MSRSDVDVNACNSEGNTVIHQLIEAVISSYYLSQLDLANIVIIIQSVYAKNFRQFEKINYKGQTIIDLVTCSRKALIFLEELLKREYGDANKAFLSAINGDLGTTIVEKIIKQKSFKGNMLASNSMYPLSLAANRFNLDIVKVLLDRLDVDVDAQETDGNTALHNLMKMVIHLYCFDEFQFKQTIAIIREIYRKRPKINLKNYQGMTVLDLAASNKQRGHLFIPELLSTETENVNTAFYFACKNFADSNTLLALIKHNSFRGNMPIKGKYPLGLAARLFRSDIVNLLLSRPDVDVEICDYKGNTILHILMNAAISSDDVSYYTHQTEISRIIQSVYAKQFSQYDRVNLKGLTFLELAASSEKTVIFISDLMLQKEFRNANKAFEYAVAQKPNSSILLKIINQKSFRENVRFHQRYPLSLASKEFFSEIVKILLDRPDVDVNEQDLDGNTALHSLIEAVIHQQNFFGHH